MRNVTAKCYLRRSPKPTDIPPTCVARTHVFDTRAYASGRKARLSNTSPTRPGGGYENGSRDHGYGLVRRRLGGCEQSHGSGTQR
jgi:hypothetical protein